MPKRLKIKKPSSGLNSESFQRRFGRLVLIRNSIIRKEDGGRWSLARPRRRASVCLNFNASRHPRLIEHEASRRNASQQQRRPSPSLCSVLFCSVQFSSVRSVVCFLLAFVSFYSLLAAGEGDGTSASARERATERERVRGAPKARRRICVKRRKLASWTKIATTRNFGNGRFPRATVILASGVTDATGVFECPFRWPQWT